MEDRRLEARSSKLEDGRQMMDSTFPHFLIYWSTPCRECLVSACELGHLRLNLFKDLFVKHVNFF